MVISRNSMLHRMAYFVCQNGMKRNEMTQKVTSLRNKRTMLKYFVLNSKVLNYTSPRLPHQLRPLWFSPSHSPFASTPSSRPSFILPLPLHPLASTPPTPPPPHLPSDSALSDYLTPPPLLLLLQLGPPFILPLPLHYLPKLCVFNDLKKRKKFETEWFVKKIRYL